MNLCFIWQIKENVNCLFLILQYPTKPLFVYCRSWIKTNSKISRKKSQESRDYSKDVKEITEQLKKMVGVRAIGWHTNWGPRRFTACLTSLEKVSENHPILVKKFLSGMLHNLWTVTFFNLCKRYMYLWYITYTCDSVMILSIWTTFFNIIHMLHGFDGDIHVPLYFPRGDKKALECYVSQCQRQRVI